MLKNFLNRTTLFLPFVCVCVFLIGPSQAAPPPQEVAVPNPLLAEEVFPFTNPSFEDGAKDWGGRAADNFQSVIVGGITFQIAPTGYAGGKSLMTPGVGYLTRNFQLKKGERYYVTCQIKTRGPARGSFRIVYGAVGEPTSAIVGPDSDWTKVSVAFTAGRHVYGWGEPPNADSTLSYMEFRLQGELPLGDANGAEPAACFFDDIHVYRLRPYAPYFRARVLDGLTSPWSVGFYGKSGGAHQYWQAKFFTKEGIEPGAWSPWTLLEKEVGAPVATAGISFFDTKGQAPPQLKVEIQFAYQPTDEAIVHSEIHQTPGNIVGYFIPQANADPQTFISGFRAVADEIRERNTRTHALFAKPVALEQYHVEGYLRGHSEITSDPALLALEIDTLRAIGFNVLDTRYSGLAGPYRMEAAKQGITKTHQTFRPWDGTLTYDLPALRVAMQKLVATWVDSLRKDDPGQLPIIRYVDIGDEIAGFYFVGPGYAAAYRDYLREQGVTPAEVGANKEDDVAPISFKSWRETRSLKPPLTDTTACGNYYWSLRFWNHANAQVFRLITEEVEKALPGVSTRVDFGPPWAYDYGALPRGSELWEFARMGAVTSFWTEDWLYPTSGEFRQSGLQMLAYETDLMHSISQVFNGGNNGGWQMYVLPGTEANIQLKLASVVGKGAKRLDLYRYGPSYISPDNWSDDLSQAKGVGNFVRGLAQAEDVLYPAKPHPARVAILWSASDALWREDVSPIYNQQMLYLALAHRQIPIDFIDEVEVARGTLKNYDVLMMSSQYIRRDAQRAVLAWVQNGGKLWADGAAGTGDEYGQASDILLPVLGISDLKITVDPKKRFTPDDVPAAPALDTMTFTDGGQSVAKAWKVNFTLSQPKTSTVLATWTGGEPAVIESTFGKGRVRYTGTLAGLSYLQGVIRPFLRIDRGYREEQRRLVTSFVLQSGIVRPVVSSVDGIEADMLEGPQGATVVLANYTGENQAMVELTIAAKNKVKAIISSQRGKLPYRTDAKGRIVVKLPLDIFDFLTLR